MISKCYLSPAAENDIDEVITYLAQENPAAAHSFLDALYDAFNKLADNPEIGHLRQDLTDKPVKFWTFKWHYLIVYKPMPQPEIVRILSGFRDIMSIIG